MEVEIRRRLSGLELALYPVQTGGALQRRNSSPQSPSLPLASFARSQAPARAIEVSPLDDSLLVNAEAAYDRYVELGGDGVVVLAGSGRSPRSHAVPITMFPARRYMAESATPGIPPDSRSSVARTPAPNATWLLAEGAGQIGLPARGSMTRLRYYKRGVYFGVRQSLPSDGRPVEAAFDSTHGEHEDNFTRSVEAGNRALRGARRQLYADLPALQANALYMDAYPVVSALSRPVIVKHLVAAAKRFGASTVAHGCTGKGNDQVRFEVGIQTLGPELKCIAPVRDLALTRDKAIAYAEAKNLPIATTKKNPFSIDQNDRCPS